MEFKIDEIYKSIKRTQLKEKVSNYLKLQAKSNLNFFITMFFSEKNYFLQKIQNNFLLAAKMEQEKFIASTSEISSYLTAT